MATEWPRRRTPSTAFVAAREHGDQPLGERAADGRRHPGRDDPVRLQAAGGGGDQADAHDPVAEELRVLLGERHDRHPAHRVADEDDRALRDDGLEDEVEVAAELLDRGVPPRRATGPAVGALVVVDGADLAAVAGALEVPRVEVERVAVEEDHRQLRRLGPAPAAATGPGVLVDLDVEVDAVVGDDVDRPGPQRPERRVVTGAAAVDDRASLGDPERRPGSGDADGAGCGAEHLAGGLHRAPPV